MRKRYKSRIKQNGGGLGLSLVFNHYAVLLSRCLAVAVSSLRDEEKKEKKNKNIEQSGIIKYTSSSTIIRRCHRPSLSLLA
jgi:hypothetical protein